MKRNLTKQKNGFTLTELVVVMFLLGLVAIIATSVTLAVNRSQQKYKIDSKSQTELLELETAFKGWLMLCDSAEYVLEIDVGSITAAKGGSAEREIEFEEGALVRYLYTDEGRTEQSRISFGSITAITFSCEDDIVCCTAYFEKSDYEHKILYTMRAAELLNKTENSEN